MESYNGKSVILTEDGVFRTVVGSYEVGSEIRYGTPIGRRKVAGRIAAAAACLLMVLSMGTYSYQNLMVYATVTLDGTAPIQLDLNRHDMVISVKAIDEAGEALAEELLDSGIKGEHFETALARAEQMIAKAHVGDEISILPHVQCKSSDKLRALTDMIRQEDNISSPAAGSDPTVSTEPSGTAPTADKPSADKPTSDKPSESSTTTETGTEAETTTSSSTEPSGEAIDPQEEDMDAQDEGQKEDMDAQEETEPMDAQEVSEPAPTPEVTTPEEPAASAVDKEESAPKDMPEEETAE
jgi:hypothetical protein